jgi:hypothetical protein
MRFKVFMMVVFQVVTPCGLVGRYQCFGRTYCLHIQSKSLVSAYKSTDVITHKTNTDRSMILVAHKNPAQM